MRSFPMDAIYFANATSDVAWVRMLIIIIQLPTEVMTYFPQVTASISCGGFDPFL
jgi:hypothetical protein